MSASIRSIPHGNVCATIPHAAVGLDVRHHRIVLKRGDLTRRQACGEPPKVRCKRARSGIRACAPDLARRPRPCDRHSPTQPGPLAPSSRAGTGQRNPAAPRCCRTRRSPETQPQAAARGDQPESATAAQTTATNALLVFIQALWKLSARVEGYVEYGRTSMIRARDASASRTSIVISCVFYVADKFDIHFCFYYRSDRRGRGGTARVAPDVGRQ